MIHFNDKEIDSIQIKGDGEDVRVPKGTNEIMYLYSRQNGSLATLWEAINSCFGSGYWIDEKPWSDDDAWKD